MSGGAWGYQQFKLREQAAAQLDPVNAALLEAVAETEHICDWAMCCDTSAEDAAKRLYALWIETFSRLYPDF